MKIAKDCGTDGEGCFSSDSYKTLENKQFGTPNTQAIPKVLLADGTALTSNITYDLHHNLIYVDLDGVKGSNTLGKDFFSFEILQGIYPDGGQNGSWGDAKTCFKSGYSCAGWVIETGNMDYLKATNGTCPNGTELSWENTSCK